MKNWLRKHKETALASGISLVLVVSGWVLAWARLRHIKEPLVLHYSTYTGINQIGHLKDLAGVGVTGLVLWAINTAFAVALDEREQFWGRVMAFATLAFGILLFFAFLAIISLNS